MNYSKAMRSISFHYHLFTEVEGSKSLIPNNTFLHSSLKAAKLQKIPEISRYLTINSDVVQEKPNPMEIP